MITPTTHPDFVVVHLGEVAILTWQDRAEWLLLEYWYAQESTDGPVD